MTGQSCLRNRNGDRDREPVVNNGTGKLKDPGTTLPFFSKGALHGLVCFQHLHTKLSDCIENNCGMP